MMVLNVDVGCVWGLFEDNDDDNDVEDDNVDDDVADNGADDDDDNVDDNDDVAVDDDVDVTGVDDDVDDSGVDDDDRRVNGQQVLVTGRTFKSPQVSSSSVTRATLSHTRETLTTLAVETLMSP